jgi:hypothetical protein
MVTYEDVVSAWDILQDANVGRGVSMHEFAIANDIERKCDQSNIDSCQDPLSAMADILVGMGFLNPMAPSMVNEAVGMATSVAFMVGILAARQERERSVDMSSFEDMMKGGEN